MRRWVPKVAKAAFLAAVGAVVAAWFRERATEIADEPVPGTAQWPPLQPLAAATEPVPVIAEPSDGAPAEPVAVPEGQTWRAPDAEGACPVGFPVKAKQRSGIYHVESGLAYDRTVPDRCYATPADAESDGFRASKM